MPNFKGMETCKPLLYPKEKNQILVNSNTFHSNRIAFQAQVSDLHMGKTG